ncbi:MAG: DUF362 domain-containing protein, partial [FCB group bacterium]|nr:DUF362 domain-containing protein [FCB group bacterium]
MSRVAVVKYTSRSRSFLKKEEYEMLLCSGLNLLAEDRGHVGFLKRLIPKGTIGLKANCLAAWNPTLIPIVKALADILIGAVGIDDNNIVLWERTSRELKRAGHELNASAFGRRCLGTDANGVGYDDDFQSSGNVNSLVTRILTRMVDHSINLPILKDHSIAGLSAGLKNMYGAIHNPNKYHASNCSPSAAHINNLNTIRDKHRLTI